MSDESSTPERRLLEMIRAVRPCPACPSQHGIPATHRYSDLCGTLNPGFKEELLIRDSRRTLEENRAIRCANQHAAVRADMDAFDEFRRMVAELPFCEYCGEKLL